MKWYLNVLKYWLAFTAVTVSTIVFAQNTPEQTPSAHDNSAHVLQQVQLDALKEIQKKDIEMLRIELAAVNKRVDDWGIYSGQGVDRLGVYASISGILVTVLLAGLGLLGFISVTRKTKAEAQDAAQSWFEGKAGTLERRIKDIADRASKAEQDITAITEDVTEHGAAAKKKYADELTLAISHMQANMGQITSDEVSKVSIEDTNILVQTRAEELKKTPEESYSFDDWNTRAHAAYAVNKLEDAAFFWFKSAQIPNADAVKVARALFNRGVTQGLLMQREAAITSYDNVVHLFGEVNESALRELVAKSLVNKGITQALMEQRDFSITTYDDVVRRFGKDSEVAIQEQVSIALVNKGITQGKLGKNEAAVVTCDEVVRRFGEASESSLRAQVAKALLYKGLRQGILKQSEEEISTYEDIIRLFGSSSEIVLLAQVATAMVNKGIVQGRLGQGESEIITYDDVVRRFGRASELSLREQVAKALVNKGARQGIMDQSEAAIVTYDDVIRRFGEASEIGLREQVAKALFNKGVVQGQLGESEAELLTYDDVVNRFGQASELSLREQVAKALVNKGARQGILDQSEAAIVTYDDVIRRFGEASEIGLREQVAKALVNKGVVQGLLGESEAELITYDDVVSRFGQVSEVSLMEQVVSALVNKGIALSRLDQYDAAVTVYEDVVQRLSQEKETVLLELVGSAQNGIGFAKICKGKAALGRTERESAQKLFLEALDYLDLSLEQQHPTLLNGLILGNKAYALALLNRTSEAEKIFAQALKSPVNGGQNLYNGTLSDFDIHPIPEDQAMRELVERQWQIWLTEQGGAPLVTT